MKSYKIAVQTPYGVFKVYFKARTAANARNFGKEWKENFDL